MCILDSQEEKNHLLTLMSEVFLLGDLLDRCSGTRAIRFDIGLERICLEFWLLRLATITEELSQKFS